MMESDAKEKFGSYSRCGSTPCYTVVTGSAQLSAYCFRQGTTTTTPLPACPEGCSCISDATAKARGGSWSRCSADICGYDRSTATLAAVVQVPKYCMKQQETTPVCPEGCVCLSDANAKARYGDFTRCTADVCGYDIPANVVAAYQVPKYCVKPAPATPVCPEGCACISDEDAKLKGLTDRCDNSQTPCGYRTADASATTAAQQIPLYCYKTTIAMVTPAAICPEGCGCMNEGDARLKFGPFNYTRCSEKVCGYDQAATNAYGSPRVPVSGQPLPSRRLPVSARQGAIACRKRTQRQSSAPTTIPGARRISAGMTRQQPRQTVSRSTVSSLPIRRFLWFVLKAVPVQRMQQL